MKKNCLAIMAIVFAVNLSYAQWTNQTGTGNYFLTSGNASIGTNIPAAWGSPYKVLDLYSYGFIYGSSNGTGFSGAGYGQTGWENNTYYDGVSHAIGTGAASSLLQGTGYLIFQNAPSVSAGNTQTFTERFRIDNNGNVGISTINPDAKLTVNGQIHSTSVRVDLNGFSDYVFKPTYILPSLSSVSSFIKEHQHLPEIPSEQEVIANGLDLGEMNKLLVKKVEELTLYAIESEEK